ncbi:CoA-binding protein [bacterium]|nr:CoA-binding protein [bacterium]
MTALNLDRLFNPRTIAMIGASATPGKWGNIILLNILKGNFKGRIFPVNPKAEKILGYPCYASVQDIPETIDMALITTPSQSILPLIDACGEKQIPFLVVVTSNFSETGDAGAKLEKEMIARAATYGIRIVGPNTMGIYSAESELHALMPMLMPLRGSVSMFSQSGNVGVQMMDYGQKEGVGFEKFVSSGNEGDLNNVDYLKYFANDKNTRVILGYIEGVDPGTGFLPTVRSISKSKPIVMFKGGRTEVGSRAAASHTGSLAGTREINRAAFRQAGIMEVQCSLELIDCAKAFANYPIPKGNRVGIITRGGGWGVITADSCEEAGLVVPPLPDDMIRRIDRILPDYWNRGNPVDLVATVADDPMPEILTMLAEWDGVDAVIALGAGFRSFNFEYSSDVTGPPELIETMRFMKSLFDNTSNAPDKILQLIADLVKKTGKPIISVSTGSQYSHKEFTERYKIVSFPTPERAVKVLKIMCEYHQIRQSR